MSILERCPSYRESNKGSKERQGPTQGVRFREVSVKRESTIMVMMTIVLIMTMMMMMMMMMMKMMVRMTMILIMVMTI